MRPASACRARSSSSATDDIRELLNSTRQHAERTTRAWRLRLATAFSATPGHSTVHLLSGHPEGSREGLEDGVGRLPTADARLQPQVSGLWHPADLGQLLESQPGGEAQSENRRVLLVDVEQRQRMDRESPCDGHEVSGMRLLLTALPFADPTVTGAELLGKFGLQETDGLAQLGDTVTAQPGPHRTCPSYAVPSARLPTDSSDAIPPGRESGVGVLLPLLGPRSRARLQCSPATIRFSQAPSAACYRARLPTPR